MSRRLRTAARALEDVRSIARWIARDNPPAAIKWVDDLNHEFVKIAQTPGIGTDRSDLRPALRSLAFGNYLVFFKTFGQRHLWSASSTVPAIIVISLHQNEPGTSHQSRRILQSISHAALIRLLSELTMNIELTPEDERYVTRKVAAANSNRPTMWFIWRWIVFSKTRKICSG